MQTMLNIIVNDKTGNLEITATPEGIEYLQDQIESEETQPGNEGATFGRIMWKQTPIAMWVDMLESYSCNGSYNLAPDDYFALNTAPVIATEPGDNGEEGDKEFMYPIPTKFWYFADYMVVDPFEKLLNGETVVFTALPEDKPEVLTPGTEPMTEELLKALALMQFNSESYFMVGTNAYKGTPEDNEGELVEEYDENDNDYLVLTDDEANEKCADYIKDSLWAFNAEFLAGETDLPVEVFTAIQDNGKCEGNNDVIEDLITRQGDMDNFISSAVSADGRGHFMSSYDGNENEETVLIDDQTGATLSANDQAKHTFYIYRIN